MTILAIGAAGKYAGLVVPELAKRGAHVRGLVRRPDQAEQVIRAGVAEVAIGNLQDRRSIEAALDSVQSVFYVAPVFLADESQVGKNFVEAAIRAGVRRFVFSAVIHPVLTCLVNHAAKVAVEEAVLNSDMEFTFLHPTFLFQNYDRFWPNVIQRGVLAEPWSAETRFFPRGLSRCCRGCRNRSYRRQPALRVI